jgi:hypothetical protein
VLSKLTSVDSLSSIDKPSNAPSMHRFPGTSFATGAWNAAKVAASICPDEIESPFRDNERFALERGTPATTEADATEPNES